VKRLGQYLFLCLVIFAFTGCSQGDYKWHTTNISGIMPDLAFSLIDQNGKTVTADTYRGQINILFFGYTNCPDVCPLTLAQLSSVLRQLPEAERKHFNVLFVSVDPARDKPAIRKAYTAAFGPEFYGLSGTLKELRKLNRRYRVTFGYGKKDAKDNYVVSHSAAMYIFDPKGRARLLAKGTESSHELTEDFQQLLKISVNSTTMD